jgi:hypothetical protein
MLYDGTAVRVVYDSVVTPPWLVVHDSTTVAGVEAGVVMDSVDPDGVVMVQVFGDGMYSVATAPLEVTTWTVLTSAGTEVVVVLP